MARNYSDTVSTQKALEKSVEIINEFVKIAKEGQIAEVTLGTFRDITIIKEVSERGA